MFPFVRSCSHLFAVHLFHLFNLDSFVRFCSHLFAVYHNFANNFTTAESIASGLGGQPGT